MSVVPTYYNSTFKHGVDEKRRLQIPAKWRPDQEGTELTVMVWPKHQAGTCLRVLPPAKMAKFAAYIEAMPNGDPNKTILKRFVGSKSVQVALDKAGRICLPDEMAGAAGIKGEAVLVGLIDLFEIWNPARHEQVEAMDAVLSPKAFEMME
jgi:MraZ protein